LVFRFGRYGYRKVTALLRVMGWSVNHKRVDMNGVGRLVTARFLARISELTPV